MAVATPTPGAASLTSAVPGAVAMKHPLVVKPTKKFPLSLLAVSAVLSACGGGSDGGSTPPSSAVTPTALASAASSADEGASAPQSLVLEAVKAVAGASSSLGASAAATLAQATPPFPTNATASHSAAIVSTQTGTTGSRAQSQPANPPAAVAAAFPGATVGPMAANASEKTSTSTTKTTSSSTPTTVTTVTDVRIYVEVGGNDGASGESTTLGASDGPVKSLTRAQQLVRTKLAGMAAGSAPRQPIRVLIGPGTYALTSTLVITPTDSGTAGAPVSYEARQFGTVTVSGGVALGSQLAPTAATTASFSAPTDNALTVGGGQLYVNGRRAILARQPNAGSAWFVQRPVTLSSDPSGSAGTAAFAPTASDLSWMASLSAADKSRAIIDVTHMWTTSRHHLVAVGTPSGAVNLTPRSYWPFMNWGVSQRYVVENVLAALDAPGEWIYDNGNVRYIRRADEAGVQITPVLPLLEKLVVVQGDSPTKTVQNVQFIGLSFAHTRYLSTIAGFLDHQSVVEQGAAIEVSKARGIVFDQCRISQTASWGIWFRDGVRESRVTNSTLTDLGAGGVKVGLTSQSATDATATGGNQINTNTVSETGKLFPGATAIWLGQTFDNEVQWNNVYRTTYTGISVGWTWGYGTAQSGRNLINGNLLYNIGQRQLGDMAGIYTLGESPGTVISNNIIREVRGYDSGAVGIYNDEGSTGIVVDNNIVVGTDTGGYFLHYGRNNSLRNNVFVGSESNEIKVGRLDTGTNLKVHRTLLVSKNTQPISQYAAAPDTAYSGTEISSALAGTGTDASKCGTGCALGKTAVTVTSTPLSITSSSTAWTTIINNAVSTRSTPAARSAMGAAEAPILPPVLSIDALPPVPVASTIAIDISGTATGARPVGLVYDLGGVSSAMQVISKAGAPDGKCLAYNDGPGFRNGYEPMAFAELSYTKGTAVVEFSLLIDNNTTFWHEWRDNGDPFTAGPSMFISSKGIQVANRTIASVDVGQWLTFKISAPMASPGAPWRLELTRANGEKVAVENLQMRHSTFTRLNWLGFISNGTLTSTPCIAGIRASNP